MVPMNAQDFSKVQLSCFRVHLGVVLQDAFLFEATSKENIYKTYRIS